MSSSFEEAERRMNAKFLDYEPDKVDLDEIRAAASAIETEADTENGVDESSTKQDPEQEGAGREGNRITRHNSTSAGLQLAIVAVTGACCSETGFRAKR